MDYNQLLDVKFRRDQDLKHLMVTKSSIRTGSGIDYPKVEPEPIKSHHKISVLNDRIRLRFLAVVAWDEAMLRSERAIYCLNSLCAPRQNFDGVTA